MGMENKKKRGKTIIFNFLKMNMTVNVTKIFWTENIKSLTLYKVTRGHDLKSINTFYKSILLKTHSFYHIKCRDAKYIHIYISYNMSINNYLCK